jgi:hypothetical protein
MGSTGSTVWGGINERGISFQGAIYFCFVRSSEHEMVSGIFNWYNWLSV